MHAAAEAIAKAEADGQSLIRSCYQRLFAILDAAEGRDASEACIQVQETLDLTATMKGVDFAI